MTNNTPVDLWPSGIFDTPIRAPVTLLREQAQLLAEKSSRLILGRVQSTRQEYSEDTVHHSLRARVPDLGNYEVELVSLKHHAQRLFPVTVCDRNNGDEKEILTEGDLTAWLRSELCSTWVVQTLKTLVAQVKNPEARPPVAPRTNEGKPDFGDIPF